MGGCTAAARAMEWTARVGRGASLASAFQKVARAERGGGNDETNRRRAFDFVFFFFLDLVHYTLVYYIFSVNSVRTFLFPPEV